MRLQSTTLFYITSELLHLGPLDVVGYSLVSQLRRLGKTELFRGAFGESHFNAFKKR